MPTMEPLCQLAGISINNLSRETNCIIEAELFTRICEHIKEIIKSNNKNYFRLIKFNTEMEDTMLDATLMCYVINDILLTEEYSLEGIALYTQTPEDVICDVLAGKNSAPSLPLSRKIIELHRFARPSLYREIMKKIASEYSIQAE